MKKMRILDQNHGLHPRPLGKFSFWRLYKTDISIVQQVLFFISKINKHLIFHTNFAQNQTMKKKTFLAKMMDSGTLDEPLRTSVWECPLAYVPFPRKRDSHPHCVNFMDKLMKIGNMTILSFGSWVQQKFNLTFCCHFRFVLPRYHAVSLVAMPRAMWFETPISLWNEHVTMNVLKVFSGIFWVLISTRHYLICLQHQF